jgi:DnaJ-class molecular chaperone
MTIQVSRSGAIPRLSDLLRVPVNLDAEVYWCVQRTEGDRVRLVHPGTAPIWVEAVYAGEVYEIRRPVVCHRLDADTVRQLEHPTECPSCEGRGSHVMRLDGHVRLWCPSCAEVWEIATRDFPSDLQPCSDCRTNYTEEPICDKCQQWHAPKEEA